LEANKGNKDDDANEQRAGIVIFNRAFI